MHFNRPLTVYVGSIRAMHRDLSDGVPNAERRPREHLSRDEVRVLVKAARGNRYGARDAAAIWIAFNHGLRVSEPAIMPCAVAPTKAG